MTAYSLSWLPEVLRRAGLDVVEEPGWLGRGHGDMGTVRGVICHDTASNLTTDDKADINLVRDGRPDLAGPLAQLVLGHGGTYYVICAGRAWHAGKGSWQGVTTGNSSFVGIEAENPGRPDSIWPKAQYDAYARGCAAILRHVGAPAIMCAGHKEYALPHGRKSDPNFDMVAFRAAVDQQMRSMP